MGTTVQLAKRGASLPSMNPSRRSFSLIAAGLLVGSLFGCTARGGCSGDYCGTLVIAAAGEPDILLPPITQLAIARDVSDQLFLKLADVGMSANTIGDDDFVPQLAARWDWTDSVTLTFHLDPRAKWQDGVPVTAADVAFTFDIYSDSTVNSPSRPALREIVAVTAPDSLTAAFRFRRSYAEMFYDAVYHMRVLPAHLLRDVPRTAWQTAPFGRQPIGDGPYRFVRWNAGESLELAADSTFFLGRPHLRRLIWRFTPNLDVAVSQLIAGQADAIEVLGPPGNVGRVHEVASLATYPYPGTTYGFLAFNLRANGDTGAPHPVFGNRELRRSVVTACCRTSGGRAISRRCRRVRCHVSGRCGTPAWPVIWHTTPSPRRGCWRRSAAGERSTCSCPPRAVCAGSTRV